MINMHVLRNQLNGYGDFFFCLDVSAPCLARELDARVIISV